MSDHNRYTSERLYEFPPGVVVRLTTRRRDALSHFDGEYRRFAVETATRVQLDIFVGNHRLWTLPPPTSNGVADYLTYQGRHKTIRWRLALWGLEEETTKLAFEGKGDMAVSFLQTFYLEPLLRIKLLKAGYSLVHAATMIKGTKSVLYPAGSSVGKTTLMLNQAIRGKAVQGDNYVIVSPVGETFAFPRRLRIYSDLLRTNPAAYRCLPLKEKFRIRLAGLIKALSFGYANLPRRLNIEQFATDCVRPSAQLDSVFSLAPHKGSEIIGPTPLALDELLDRVQAQSFLEGGRLQEVLAPYLASHPDSPLHCTYRMEHDILIRAMAGLPAYEILVPRVDDPGRVVSELGRMSGLEGGTSWEPVSL